MNKNESANCDGILEVDKQQAQELCKKVHKTAMEHCSNDNVTPLYFDMDLAC